MMSRTRIFVALTCLLAAGCGRDAGDTRTPQQRPVYHDADDLGRAMAVAMNRVLPAQMAKQPDTADSSVTVVYAGHENTSPGTDKLLLDMVVAQVMDGHAVRVTQRFSVLATQQPGNDRWTGWDCRHEAYSFTIDGKSTWSTRLFTALGIGEDSLYKFKPADGKTFVEAAYEEGH